VKLQRGSGGVFDVLADGELLYSKHRTGTFPDEAQIVGLLKERAP